MTIGAALHDIRRSDPDGPALRFKGSAISKAELYRAVQAAGAVLRRAGIGPGDRVALLAENCPEILFCYYACAAIGAVFIPLNANLTAPDIRYIVGHSAAQLLLHDDGLAGIAASAAPAVARMPLADLALGEVPESDRLGAENPGDFLVIYTSGTTGLPKAVVFDQQAEFAGNQALVDMWGMTSRDVTLVALPMGFLYGLSTAAATALQAGGEVVVLPKFHPRDVLEAMRGEGASVFQGVPTMFSMMLDYAEQNGLDVDLSGMRLMISAGAPLSDELRARFQARFGKRIDDYYALTEVRPVFGKYASDPSEVPRLSLGKAAPGAIVRIVGNDGADVPDGETGEVLVRAASTLDRYLGNDEQTRAAFRDGFFRTGDLGHRDAQGFYYLTGRIKDIIIRGGANIAPAEVEQALSSHVSVSSAAVFGIADPVFGEVPVAYVLLRTGHVLDEAALTAHCRVTLAAFKVPVAIRAIAAFPLGKTGKVDKAALLARWKALP